MNSDMIRQPPVAARLAAVALAAAAGIAGCAAHSGIGASGGVLRLTMSHHRSGQTEAGQTEAGQTEAGQTEAGRTRAGRTEAPFATRAESLRLGRELLTKVVLPAGTRRFFGRKLPADVRQPPESSSASTVIDVHRVFAARRSMRRTVAFLNHHHPTGWYSDGSGSLSYRSVVTAEYVAYTPRHVGAAFNDIEMLVTVVPRHHRHALVRVDVQVTWYPRRPAAEYLAARDFRAVRVERQFYGEKPVWRTFRRRAIIDKLTRVLNLTPASPGGTWSCPQGSNYYQLTFKPVKGKPRAVVAALGCPPIDSVSIGGHSRPALIDDGKIEAIVDHLLRGSHKPTR